MEKTENKLIGQNHPVFIIAEAGINHNGDFEIAREMVRVAKDCGADAVKFQAFRTEELIINEAPKAEHTKGKKSFFEMIKSWELSLADYVKLAKFAKKLKIILFASVFGEESLRIMQKIVAPIIKIASCDLNNHFLLEKIAATKKPLILSTGMGDLKEIKQAVRILESGTSEIGILHCVSLYPPQAEELNLQRIAVLKKNFPRHIIGYSDHTLDIFVPVSAVALDAKIIEKHFTLDKNMPGPDQQSSANPAEFKQMVQQIRFLEKAINQRKKSIICGIKEREMRKSLRRSLVANETIPKGTEIAENMLGIKRPGTGIPPSDIAKVVGRKAKRDLGKNEIISYSDLL